MRYLFHSVLVVIAATLTFPTTNFAQRDYFTAEEVELIRNHQEIDKRINVLVRAIDRRFAVLKIDVASPPFKEKSEWGALPSGSRPELIRDIKRIMQKAVDDIDSLAERPDSAVLPDPEDKKKVEGYAVLFPRAVRSLAQAAARYAPVLKTELDKATDASEKGSLLDTLELCELIIASVSKLPADVQKPGKKHN